MKPLAWEVPKLSNRFENSIIYIKDFLYGNKQSGKIYFNEFPAVRTDFQLVNKSFHQSISPGNMSSSLQHHTLNHEKSD
jgi:hypothetical protein